MRADGRVGANSDARDGSFDENQQLLIERDELRFTFSFQFSSPFAAIHHNSHDTGMTPTCVRLGARQNSRLSYKFYGIPGRIIHERRIILDELEHIFI